MKGELSSATVVKTILSANYMLFVTAEYWANLKISFIICFAVSCGFAVYMLTTIINGIWA